MLERDKNGEPALRLGLRLVKGLTAGAGQRLLVARQEQSFVSAQDLAERAELDRRDLAALAAADALCFVSGHRYRARWEVAGVEPPTPLFPQLVIAEGLPLLPSPSMEEEVVADYRSLGLSLRSHPMALLRQQLQQSGWLSCAELKKLPHNAQAAVAGLVITRQRPGSASGIVFVTLEDESDHSNIIIWPKLVERQRREVLEARLLGVRGRVQREGEVLHLIARRLEDHSHLLGQLATRSRDFH